MRALYNAPSIEQPAAVICWSIQSRLRLPFGIGAHVSRLRKSSACGDPGGGGGGQDAGFRTREEAGAERDNTFGYKS